MRLLAIALALVAFQVSAQRQQNVDVLVFGATSGGVIAASAAAKEGVSVMLVDTEWHVGGMSSGGLGQTDIGNKFAITGMSRNFYRRIGAHYGKVEQWIFEPHVADSIFRTILREDKIDHRQIGRAHV